MTYQVEMKLDNGQWFSVWKDDDLDKVREKREQCERICPDREFQVVRVEVIRTVL